MQREGFFASSRVARRLTGLRSFWLKVGKGRSPRSGLRGSALEGFNKRTSFQEGMNDGPLDAHSLSVDDPHTSKPPLLTFEEVFFQERWNLSGRKRVQVDPVFDGNTNCFRLALEIGHLSLNGSPLSHLHLLCRRISSWRVLKSFGGRAFDFRTSRTAAEGQPTAQTPHPMHHASSTPGKSPSISTAPTGQISAQRPQPLHSSRRVSRIK